MNSAGRGSAWSLKCTSLLLVGVAGDATHATRTRSVSALLAHDVTLMLREGATLRLRYARRRDTTRQRGTFALPFCVTPNQRVII